MAAASSALRREATLFLINAARQFGSLEAQIINTMKVHCNMQDLEDEVDIDLDHKDDLYEGPNSTTKVVIRFVDPENCKKFSKFVERSFEPPRGNRYSNEIPAFAFLTALGAKFGDLSTSDGFLNFLHEKTRQLSQPTCGRRWPPRAPAPTLVFLCPRLAQSSQARRQSRDGRRLASRLACGSARRPRQTTQLKLRSTCNPQLLQSSGGVAKGDALKKKASNFVKVQAALSAAPGKAKSRCSTTTQAFRQARQAVENSRHSLKAVAARLPESRLAQRARPKQ